ncbi:ATP-binding protein [Caldiplasma sukawensis]
MHSYLESSHGKTVMEILDHLLLVGLKHKISGKSENVLKFSGFPFLKTKTDFDFSFQPSIDRSVIDEFMTMRYINNNWNIVFLGSSGDRNTHFSIALRIRSIMSDIPAYYISAMKLVQTLKKDYDLKRLEYRIRTYSRFKLMILDEIGYLPLTREESNLFFQLVLTRYEKRSTIYTGNKSFSELGEDLVDSVMAAAVLSRILHHHCTVINLKGESYSLKYRKKNSLQTIKKE